MLDDERIDLFHLPVDENHEVLAVNMWVRNSKLYTEYEIVTGECRGRRILRIESITQAPEGR